MIKSACLVFFIVLVSCFGYGQSSFLQDGKGESSLKIFDDEIVINTSNESISLQYFNTSEIAFTKKIEEIAGQNGDYAVNDLGKELLFPSNNPTLFTAFKDLKNQINNGEIDLQDEFSNFTADEQKEILEIISNSKDYAKGLVYSFSLKFTANQGVSKLFDTWNFVPQVDGGIILGLNEVPKFDNIKNKVKLSYAYLGAAIQRSEFKLFNDANLTLDDEEFVGFSISGGYNIIGEWTNCEKSVTFFGFGLRAGRFNTFDDLKKIETSTTTTLTNNSVLLESITSGFRGDYETFYGMNLLADGYIYPSGWNNRVGLGMYGRYNSIGNTPRLNFGFGGVVTKDKKPTNVVLSFMFQFTDVFNNLEVEDSALFDRFGVNLIAGYKL